MQKREKEQILQQIRKRFELVHQRLDIQGYKKWTEAFLNVLYELGMEQNGIKVYSSSVGKIISKEIGGGEWLFDLCWSIEDDGDDGWKKNYKGLKLICESEWRLEIDEILYDFQKLAVAKADIKIMIVQYFGDEFVDITKQCENSVDKSLYNDGSFYYLVGSSNGPGDSLIFKQLWKDL